MKIPRFMRTMALVALGFCINSSQALAAGAPNAALTQAKQAADQKGLTFETDRNVILAKAKNEGQLRVLSSLDPESFQPMIDSFKKKYPFADVQISELTGTEALQRHLLELKTGTLKNWDVLHASQDAYSELSAHAMKLDVLGMAEQGVLRINPKMIDPENRAVVAIASGLCSIAYNKTLVPADQVPNQLEDVLKPFFKGKKLVVDIRPHCMAALMAGQGEEWVINFARKLKAQDPAWVRGNTRALTSIASGEYPMHQLTNYHSCVRATQKDKRKSLVCKVIEPVPIRIQEPDFIVSSAKNIYTGLLFLEHEASPEGQKILDEIEPMKSSLFGGGAVSKVIAGKKISLNDFSTYAQSQDWMKKIIEAYGFPKADRRR